jgi:phosphate transport system substrate-binding protein
VKLNRVGAGAGVLAAAVALAACSSSGSKSGSTGAQTSAAGSTTASAVAGGSSSCPSGSLSAEGSTAQTNAVTKWINDYTKQCSGTKVSYNPTGSGAGVSQFNAGKVDFAGSDSALDPKAGEVAAAAKRCAGPAMDLPMVVGPVALGYKLSGVTSLALTPALIAKIFTGKITTWNDPAIAAANKSAKLPSSKISVVFRSDSSGTTSNFEKYLAANDPTDFKATPAKDNAAKVFKGQGAAKSQGVAQAIGATDGSIGYIEYSFAAGSSLATAKLDSGSGPVTIGADTASKAVADAQVVGTGNDLSLKLNYASKAAGAYPLLLVTYEIACTKYTNATTGKLVKSFLQYTSTGGQQALPGLGYAPLPSSLLTKVKASIAKIS